MDNSEKFKDLENVLVRDQFGNEYAIAKADICEMPLFLTSIKIETPVNVHSVVYFEEAGQTFWVMFDESVGVMHGETVDINGIFAKYLTLEDSQYTEIWEQFLKEVEQYIKGAQDAN